MTHSEQDKTFSSRKFTLDPSLGPWDKPAKDCLREGRNKAWDGIATACVVFNHDGKVLMIQRASHDSLPNKWELPGGAVDDDDPTILHAAARELWEESGLVATHFSHILTQGQGRSTEETFSNRLKTKLFARYTFAVDVESCEHVQLDANEHQNYVWVSADDVKAQKAGAFELDVTKETVAAIVLEAFRLRQRKSQAL